MQQTAKLFNNGGSQAVRLPKEYRFSGDSVYVKKMENMVLLIPKDNPWMALINSLDEFSDDYMNDRNQPTEQQKRSPIGE